MSAKVVSFINLKDGVGKTTLVVAIGETLAFCFKKKVLLIDMDHQTNLTYAMITEEDVNKYKTTWDMFEYALSGKDCEIKECIVKDCSNIKKNGEIIHLLPANPSLVHLEDKILENMEKGVKFSVDLRKVLKNHLSQVLDEYDYILIDCPPNLALPTQNAMLASDYFVVPIIPEFLSLQGLDQILNRIDGLKEKYGDNELKINFAGVIINKLHMQRKMEHLPMASALYYNENSIKELSPLVREDSLIIEYFSRMERGKRGEKYYKPFYWWLGDLKPLYTITDYQYPKRIKKQGKEKEKWIHFGEKYTGGKGGSIRATNPDPYGPWDKMKRPNVSANISVWDYWVLKKEVKLEFSRKKYTKEYNLVGRIVALTSEFMERCR